MSSPSFLLALAPAASALASRTVSAAQNAGESFASVLSTLLQAPETEPGSDTATATTANGPSATQETLTERIRNLADQLRKWLQDQGATSDYSIDYHLAADGTSQLEVDGASPAKVKEMLATDPSWMAKLRQLASSMQADAANRYQAGEVSSVTIAIDPTETRIY